MARVADQHKFRLSQDMSPKSVENNAIDTEAIDLEDLEPGKN